MSNRLPPVYPITSERRGHLACVQSYLAGGARLLQVRDKSLCDEDLVALLIEARELCHAAGARVVVNDRADLAAAARCDGVHLGQDDPSPSEARRLLGAGALIGLSTHDRGQFVAAQREPVDYVAIGPVFATSSKADAAPVVAEARLARLLELASRPVVAIGGITPERATRLWALGVHSVAVIGDLANSRDPEAQMKRYVVLGQETLEHA